MSLVAVYMVPELPAIYFFTKVPIISEYTREIAIEECESSVIVPILESQVSTLEENSTGDNLKAIIDKGFRIVWKANNSLCYDCQTSGGRCGYNTSSSEFTCYCEGGPGSVRRTCGSSKY